MTTSKQIEEDKFTSGKKQKVSKLEKARGVSKTTGEVDFREIDPAALHFLVANVVTDGAAIMLSLTSDSGALVLTVLDGAERQKWYLHGGDEINYTFRAVGETYHNG